MTDPRCYHWYVASSLPASLPRVSLILSLSFSFRLLPHDFLTHFCYGYIAIISIAIISIAIKSYSTKSFSINIGLLTYRGITIIPSYRPALLHSKEITFQDQVPYYSPTFCMCMEVGEAKL